MSIASSDIVLAASAFFIYFIVKWIVYSLWCAKGIKYLGLTFTTQTLSSRQRIILLGFVRTLIGVLFGMIFYLIAGREGNSAQHLVPHTLPLACLLVSIRWFEWSVMEYIMNQAVRVSLFTFLFGANNQSRIWRFLGILVSFTADAIFISVTFIFGFMALASGLFGRMC